MNTAPRHKNDGHPIRQDQVTVEQTNILQEDPMSTTQSTFHQTHDLPPARHLPWCDRSLCTSHGGPDVIHVGQTVTLERFNKNGDGFTFTATPQQLEERGYGYTTEKYVNLVADSEPFGSTIFNIDIDELENLADFLCGVVEQVKP